MNVSPVQKTRACIGDALLIAKMDSLGQWSPAERKIMVYFKDDTLSGLLSCGDLILISGNIRTLTGPPNPEMFDFRRYLYNQGITCQIFLEQGRWMLAGKTHSNPVRQWAESCRSMFLDILRKFKLDGQEFALAAALLLGSRDYLEKDIIQAFSHAGVIHVLSVSGLHVGIMYVVADKVLFFLKRGRKSRKLHQLLILAFIWAYAFITGLPSSVVRAALMFSLIAACKMLKRSSENYNILAVAAFLQLWIDPYQITQVGFQLSYLAVLGIFAFYNTFNNSITSINGLFRGVWSILMVSMAAQLATFPLACYYFNMFPVYFLMTNLIVVPLAAIVTYFAVSLLAVGAAGLTFEWLAWPLKWSLRFMGNSVETIQSWPGAVIDPVVLTTVQVILIYTAIMGLFVMSVQVNRRGLFVILGAMLFFTTLSCRDLYEKLRTTGITVYQISGHTAIDLIQRRHSVFLCDSLLLSDPEKMDFNVKPYRTHCGIKDIQNIKVEDKPVLSAPGILVNYPFIYLSGKMVVIIDSNWSYNLTGDIFTCDLAIFSGNPGINPGELIKQLEIKESIIDNSVPNYRASQLIQFFNNAGIPCHSVRQEGAYIMMWR